jgi:hypothetical protein
MIRIKDPRKYMLNRYKIKMLLFKKVNHVSQFNELKLSEFINQIKIFIISI